MVSKQKILIVDDDNNIAELISLYLTKECFETMIVNDGESALTAVDAFDPNLHNAVMHVEDETKGENEIVEVFQKGFKLGDKVIRFAMVKVAN